MWYKETNTRRTAGLLATGPERWAYRRPKGFHVRFSGHETFACRYAWLPKAVAAIQGNPRIFSDEDGAMVELGVGKNMVRSMRFWVEAASMAAPDGKTGLVVTPLGTAIFGRDGLDPWLEDIQTLWLIHWKIATNPDPLFAWQFLLCEWHAPEFTEHAAVTEFVKEAERLQKRLSLVTLQQHFQVFLHTYLPTRAPKGAVVEDNLDCPLTELEMVMNAGEREASDSKRRDPVYAFRRDPKPTISDELFAYCVADYWRRFYSNEETLSARTLVSGLASPGHIFKLPEDDVYTRFSRVASASGGVLTFHESAVLKQLRRSQREIDMEALLANIYS